MSEKELESRLHRRSVTNPRSISVGKRRKVISVTMSPSLLLVLLASLLPLASSNAQRNYGSGPDLSQGYDPAGGNRFGSGSGNSDLELWQTERPADMANIADLEVMCGKRHMEVKLTFDRPFNGIVFSKGAVDRYDCIYVKPQTGQTTYKFDIQYDQCGSKPDLNGKFYENNIVVQYDKDLIEVWDEAKRLRCEWYNDYEKGVTKPPIRVSDLEVVELNFRGDNVDCWMEVQQGKGPWASPVQGIVPLGTTLTMVVGIDDKAGEFDMRVKSCDATDNRNRPIRLSDEDGCVLRPKMLSKFMKMRSTDPRATVVTYAFFHAFKFPDSMAVQIRCKVEICRYGCPDHCQSSASYQQARREQEVTSSLGSYNAGPVSSYSVPVSASTSYTSAASGSAAPVVSSSGSSYSAPQASYSAPVSSSSSSSYSVPQASSSSSSYSAPSVSSTSSSYSAPVVSSSSGSSYSAPSTSSSSSSYSAPTSNSGSTYSAPTSDASSSSYSAPVVNTGSSYSAPSSGGSSSSYSAPSASSSSSSYSAPSVPSGSYSPPSQPQYGGLKRRRDELKKRIKELKKAYRNKRPNGGNKRPENRRRKLPRKQTKRRTQEEEDPYEHQRSGGQYSPVSPTTLKLPRPLALEQGRSASSQPESLLPPPPPKLPRVHYHQRQQHQQHAQRVPPPQRHRIQAHPNRRIDDDADVPSDNPNANTADNNNNKEEKQSGLSFLGLKLPQLPLPELPRLSLPSFFGGGGGAKEKQDDDEDKIITNVKEVDGYRVKSEAIPVKLGRRPPSDALKDHNKSRRPSSVPISRTASSSGSQPLVYPSSFDAATSGPSVVVPIEAAASVKGAFPYGPRALNIETIEKLRRKKRTVHHHRQTRSADIGVRSGYEVVSGVDLDFNPDDVDGVSVLKGRIHDDDVVYGICLPATGFSALFVCMALATVISVLVSGFVCYHRQLQKAAEESAPAPPPPPPQTAASAEAAAIAAVAAAAAAAEQQQQQQHPSEQQMGWGFDTWFRKNHRHPAVRY